MEFEALSGQLAGGSDLNFPWQEYVCHQYRPVFKLASIHLLASSILWLTGAAGSAGPAAQVETKQMLRGAWSNIVENADAAYHQGDVKTAEVLYAQALKLARKIPGDVRPLISSMRDLASFYHRIHQLDKERSWLLQALAVAQKHYGNAAQELDPIVDSLARLAHEKENYRDEEMYLQTLLASRKKVVGVDSLSFLRALSRYCVLSIFFRQQNLLSEATAVERKWVQLLPQNEGSRRQLGRLIVQDNLVALGDFNGGRSVPCLSLVLALEPEPTEARAFCLHYLGAARTYKGDAVAGGKAFAEAAKIRIANGHFREAISSLDGLGMAQRLDKRSNEAEHTYRQALALWRNVVPVEPHGVGVDKLFVGVSLSEQGKWDKASPWLTQALTELKRCSAPKDPYLELSTQLVLECRKRGSK